MWGQEPLALPGAEPVPNTDTNPANSFDPSDAGRKLRAVQAGIGGLVGHASNGGEAQVDRRLCVQLLFEIDPVSQDDGSIECEARF